jgi:hypothetical protein
MVVIYTTFEFIGNADLRKVLDRSLTLKGFFATLDDGQFRKKIKKKDGNPVTSHVMSQEDPQQYLNERYSVILTDDYVSADNLIAPIFEERFGC